MTSTEATSQFERHTYEDPFLDMSSTKLPKSMRKLQELCQIFAMTHPQISPIIWRLAEYPITSLVYTGNEEARRQYKEIFEAKLGILDRAVEWGLDYNSYGNCFVSISFPFIRFYRCRTCKSQFQAGEMKGRRYDGQRFTAMCQAKECHGSEREFDPHDQYVRRAEGVHVFRLEPMLMTIKYNRITGQYFYFYDIPLETKQAVQRSDWDIIDTTPASFLKCIRTGTKMRIKRVFHFKRPTLSGRDMQWGLPLVMPALKDAYLNQIYKKADEAIALEHSVPLRILFPEPGSQDPLSRIALGSFKGFMEQNIKYWRRDKNAIITAPLPVGVRVIGGDQGSYQTIQARQFVVDEIIGAMMVTKGFVMGNEQWSAASVSQRILENSFLNYLRRLDQCLQWVAEEVRAYLRLPECGLAMKPFKKVDDVQMVQLIIQMAREKRVSWNEALSRVDLDAAEQLKQIESESEGYLRIMIQELIGQAEAGAKSAVIQAQGQSEAEGAQAVLAAQQQKALPGGPPQQGQEQGASVTPAGAPGEPAQGEQQPEAYPEPELKNQNVAMDPQIDSWAQELLKLPPDKMKEMLGRMATQNPELGKAVAERASALRGMAMGGGEKVSIDELLSQAKSPDELVARMQLMDPKVQLQALRAIQQRNPGLGLKVMQAMAKANQQQAGMAPSGGSDGVDMRPQPEQRPPRRETKAV